MAIDRWIQRWYVTKSTGDGQWCVALDRDGIYGCSCPVWKFKKQECKHIRGIKSGMGGEAKIVEPAIKRKVVAETTKTFEREISNPKPKEEVKPEMITSKIGEVDAKLEEIMGRWSKGS